MTGDEAPGLPKAPPTATLLSVGECMIEMAPNGAGAFDMNFAGDSFNFAWYARKALPPDWRVGYLTAVGDDALSRKLRDFMAEAGIDTTHVAMRADRTVGLYLIHLDGGERSFSYWRGASAARLLAAEPDTVRAALAPAGVIYFSGITAAILEPATRDAFHDALGQARSQGKLVVFDPNLRPRLWSGTAEMTREITRAAGRADIVLPSFEDEAQVFGDADATATAQRYRDLGAAMVVVKNGAGPVLVSAGDSDPLSVAPAPVAEIVDTTAAGDSFNAAFLAALLAHRPVPEAVTTASELAGRVVRRRGALVDPDGTE